MEQRDVTDLSDKVALVSGAASGIGEASVRALAALGAFVVVVDVDEERGSTLASEVNGRFMAADVGDPSAWAVIAQEIEEDVGGLDFVHLNAGVPTGEYPVRLEAVTDEAYSRVLGINASGVFFGVRALAPGIVRRGGGAVVVTSSVAGLMPLPQDPVYAATKHFVIGLVRSLAATLAEQHIRINAVCPGGVDTPLVDSTGQRGAIADTGRRLLDPAQVAAVVVELLTGTETGEVYTVLQTSGTTRYDFTDVAGIQR